MLNTFRVYTDGLFKDIKASYVNIENGILFIHRKDEYVTTTVAGFIDWQFYEVLDES